MARARSTAAAPGRRRAAGGCRRGRPPAAPRPARRRASRPRRRRRRRRRAATPRCGRTRRSCPGRRAAGAPSSRGGRCSSSSRLAARPVGAASAMSVPLARSSLTTRGDGAALAGAGAAGEQADAGLQHLRDRGRAGRRPAPWRRCAPTPGRRSARRWRPAGRSPRPPAPRPCRSGPATACAAPDPARRPARRVRRLVLEHVAGLDGGHDRGRRVADALGLQRGDDEVGRQHGVPVAGRRPQGERRRSPGRGGCPAGRRRAGRRSPAGRRRRA